MHTVFFNWATGYSTAFHHVRQSLSDKLFVNMSWRCGALAYKDRSKQQSWQLIHFIMTCPPRFTEASIIYNFFFSQVLYLSFVCRYLIAKLIRFKSSQTSFYFLLMNRLNMLSTSFNLIEIDFGLGLSDLGAYMMAFTPIRQSTYI